MKVGDNMVDPELSKEIEKIKESFPNADTDKVKALIGLIEQAAHEKIYLKRLNGQAMITGLVKIHPKNPTIQKVLPVSNEITKHSATLTNIMNQLMKHLAVEKDDEEDEELNEYE